jgi:SAM-dependent MidA family methyltransferase
MNDIPEIIGKEAARQGVISFARFMELALYCPNSGYYEQPGSAPGQRGDFYTSVSVGGLFGELLARQFAGWLDELGPGRHQIVEAGAHNGRLAGDILGWLQKYQPQKLESLKYWIVEPSSARRKSQFAELGDLARHVEWFESWAAVPATGVHGIIFSNELLDAMPVHRLGWDAARKRWFEWGVALREGSFVWMKMPEERRFNIEKSEFGEYWLEMTKELMEVLPDGFVTEISPAALEWWCHAARTLREGRLVSIDYGLAAEEFFTPGRSRGTLRGYYRHHPSDDLLTHAGEQDLTAHVNFSMIKQAGEKEGLQTEALITQARFLTEVLEKSMHSPAPINLTSPRVRQFQTLTHPEHLGQSFRVLIQSRLPR